MISQPIYIEVDDYLYERITSVQYDNGTRFLDIHLLSNGQAIDLTGTRVIISGEKPDGEEIFNSTTMKDALNGNVIVELTEQMNAVPGDVKCQLEIYGEAGQLLTTKTFNIEVTKRAGSKTVASSSEFGALKKALEEVQDIDNRFAQTNARVSEIENKKADKDEIGKPTQEQVDNWLNNNPQATTTVQENSISPSKTTFVKTYNLFNKNNAKNGYTITTAGIVESSVPDDFVTEKIELNTYVIVKGLTQGYYLYTYKTDGSLSRITISDTAMSFNSKDVEYVEIAGNYKDQLEIYQLGNYDIHKDGYIVNEYVNETISPNRTKNLFNYRKAMIGFRDSGGYLVSGDKHFVSEFIRNEKFLKIYTNFDARAVFYDASYAYISHVNIKKDGNTSVPTNTCYFTISLWGYMEDITIDFLKTLMVACEEIKEVEPYYTYSTGLQDQSTILSEVNTYNLFDKSNALRNYSVDNEGNIYTVDHTTGW